MGPKKKSKSEAPSRPRFTVFDSMRVVVIVNRVKARAVEIWEERLLNVRAVSVAQLLRDLSLQREWATHVVAYGEKGTLDESLAQTVHNAVLRIHSTRVLSLSLSLS